MTDLAQLQTLLAHTIGPAYQMQEAEQGSTTLTVRPDGQAVLGPAGSQLVYTFQDGHFMNMEILVAAG